MQRRTSSKVTVRGVTYKNAEAAAKALNVDRRAVYSAIDRGTLDTLGTRTAAIARVAALCPFTVRGLTFQSFAECATHFGLTEETVKHAVRRGRAEFIGIPSHKTRSRSGPMQMCVRVRGKVFETVDAAAKHFGVSPITVRSAIAAGRADYIGLGRRRKHANHKRGHAFNAKQVKIGARVWPSIKACAAELKCNRETLKRHLVAGNMAWLVAKLMAETAKAEGHKARLPQQISDDERAAISKRTAERWAAVPRLTLRDDGKHGTGNAQPAQAY